MADDAITHGCIGGPGSPMCIYNGFEHRYRPFKKNHFVIILIEKKINIFQLFVRASGRRSRIQSTLLRTLISFLSACIDFICDFIRWRQFVHFALGTLPYIGEIAGLAQLVEDGRLPSWVCCIEHVEDFSFINFGFLGPWQNYLTSGILWSCKERQGDMQA